MSNEKLTIVRVSTNPERFRLVLTQQGRVQLDSDLNEQEVIDQQRKAGVKDDRILAMLAEARRKPPL